MSAPHAAGNPSAYWRRVFCNDWQRLTRNRRWPCTEFPGLEIGGSARFGKGTQRDAFLEHVSTVTMKIYFLWVHAFCNSTSGSTQKIIILLSKHENSIRLIPLKRFPENYISAIQTLDMLEGLVIDLCLRTGKIDIKGYKFYIYETMAWYVTACKVFCHTMLVTEGFALILSRPANPAIAVNYTPATVGEMMGLLAYTQGDNLSDLEYEIIRLRIEYDVRFLSDLVILWCTYK